MTQNKYKHENVRWCALWTVSDLGCLSYALVVNHVKENVKATNSTVTDKCCKMHKDFSARNTIFTDFLKNDRKLKLKLWNVTPQSLVEIYWYFREYVSSKLWDVTLCSLVEIYWCFGEYVTSIFWVLKLEAAGFAKMSDVSHPRRYYSSQSLPWESHVYLACYKNCWQLLMSALNHQLVSSTEVKV